MLRRENTFRQTIYLIYFDVKQINEKERERIVECQKIFEKNLTISAEIEMRRKKLQDAMEQKCQKMKEDNVSDIYINEVKRMIENIR